jgi:alanine racemase
MNDSVYRVYEDMSIYDISRVWTEIDLDALRYNFNYVKNRIHSSKSDCRFIAVIKANGYGHGIDTVCRTLAEEGCDFFAVATLDEAIAVRAALESTPYHPDILMLGSTVAEYAPLMAKYDLIVSLPSEDYSRKLAAVAKENGVVVRAHAKLDTGMNRIGYPTFTDADCHSTAASVASIASLPSISLEGVYSHFACAEESSEHAKARTHLQAERFFGTVELMENYGYKPPFVHICNGSGAFVVPQYLADGARIGIVIFGFDPSPKISLPLKPTMKLCASVTRVMEASEGEEVSYGGTYKVEKPTKIATVGIGYADGLYRSSSGASVGFRKKSGEFIGRGTIIGRVCMDMCMVDVTGLDVEVGDTLVVFENTEDVRNYCNHVGTIPHELICHISPRVPRILIGK